MSRNPLVSIGLPTYNRAATLRRAIESALKQDYQNIELLISDNASSDETQGICKEFCAQDGRVKYIRQSSNVGARASFFALLQVARGEFFMCLADDDWLDNSYVSRCADKLLKNPDYALVCGRAKYFQDGQLLPEGETIDLRQDCAEERVLAYYEQVIHNGTFYGLMRRQQLHLALPPNVLGGDWLFIAAIAFLGKIETIESTSVNRSWVTPSRSFKTLVQRIGVSKIHACVPVLSIAIAACNDIARGAKAYASLSRWARLSLACRVFAVFCRRYLSWAALFSLVVKKRSPQGDRSPKGSQGQTRKE